MQNQAFCKETEVFKKKRNISRTSRIYGLDSHIDSNGLLRVGGRLVKGELDANIVHSVLLPKKSCMSVEIIRRCHENVAHGGRGLTMSLFGLSVWFLDCQCKLSHQKFDT